MKLAKDMIRDPRGSDKSVKSDRDVNTLAVSSVSPSPLFRARTENSVNVRIGAAIGVLKPRLRSQPGVRDGGFEFLLLKAIFQTKIFRNFFEMRNSLTRRSWRVFDKISVRPHIFTPFIAPSIVVVAVIRLSMALSHRACRAITSPDATIDPIMETVVLINS